MGSVLPRWQGCRAPGKGATMWRVVPTVRRYQKGLDSKLFSKLVHFVLKFRHMVNFVIFHAAQQQQAQGEAMCGTVHESVDFSFEVEARRARVSK